MSHQDYLGAPPQLLLGEEMEELQSGDSERGILIIDALWQEFHPPPPQKLPLSHLGLDDSFFGGLTDPNMNILVKLADLVWQTDTKSN